MIKYLLRKWYIKEFYNSCNNNNTESINKIIALNVLNEVDFGNALYVVIKKNYPELIELFYKRGGLSNVACFAANIGDVDCLQKIFELEKIKKIEGALSIAMIEQCFKRNFYMIEQIVRLDKDSISCWCVEDACTENDVELLKKLLELGFNNFEELYEKKITLNKECYDILVNAGFTKKQMP